VSRAAAVVYLASLALLPWGAWPPFPWLHEHAQWSDVLFAASAGLWALERLRSGPALRPRLVHAAMALYLGGAVVSHLLAEPRAASGAPKLLGMAMLVLLAVVTADLLRRPGMAAAVARTVAGTALLTAAAAAGGVALFLLGFPTPLVGTYGDLLPGAYARAQAGFPHPNLLASFCVFAAGVVTRADAGLPRPLRTLTLLALAATVGLTFSRGILAFGLVLLVRYADTPVRRRLAAAWAGAAAATVLALSIWNVAVDPSRPGELRVLDRPPSSRAQAAASAWDTLLDRPWTGSGPGTPPGRRDGRPFDAHCTPLNVAATLGLPALLGFAALPFALWRARGRPTDRATWGILAGLATDGLASDVEDFRHVWVAIGLADAGRANLGPR